MLQTDQMLQNRYRIQRVLGQGGMGAVYQAHDLSLDVTCVVKEMLSPPDPAMVNNMAAQFHREGKILAGLRHMSLPRVSNYFVENENYYLVMDLIEGRSLEKLIGTDGLYEPVVLAYADQLLDVLGYIHGRGILHRDIKPANIIVQPDGRAVLVDFGLVKIVNTGGPATKTLVSALTPQYAPPEQYTGNTDQRSDLYSLAATLYQALAGSPPASATDQLSGMPLQSLRQFHHLVQPVSPNTERVLMKALALDRSRRYQDAASMRADLTNPSTKPGDVPGPIIEAEENTQVWAPPGGQPPAPAQPISKPVPHVSTAPQAGAGAQAHSAPIPAGVPAPIAYPSGGGSAAPASPGYPGASSTATTAKKPINKLLLVGSIILGVLVIGCCLIFGGRFLTGFARGLTDGKTPVSGRTATPIPLDQLSPTNTRTAAAPSATSSIRGGLTTSTPRATSRATPKVTAAATATYAPQAVSTYTGIEATVASQIIMAATDTAGTPPAADERYLTLAYGVYLDLARVPAGDFIMGSLETDQDATRDEFPQETITLGEYWIGVDDVTVEQFAAFVLYTGYKTTAETVGSGLVFNSSSAMVQVKGANWREPGGPGANVPNDVNYPVVQVSWDDASAFCAWASKVTGRKVKLPTEAQWEKAARGTDGRLYPWGNNPPTSALANFNNQNGSVMPIGSYSPDGDSPYGLTDMAGNVWQWTNSLALPYPYVANDGREVAKSSDARVVRGGAYRNGFIPGAKNSLRSAARGGADPTLRNTFVSFRVLVEP